MKGLSGVFAFLLALSMLVPPLAAQTVLIDEDFATDPSANWQLNGSAAWDSANGRVVMTPALNDQRSSMFYKTVLDINNFKLEAKVKLCCGSGADGMAITFIEGTEADATRIGDGGGGMCVTNLTTGPQIVIEFDIWGNPVACEDCACDGQLDAAGNHIGIEYSPTGFLAGDCIPNDDNVNSACACTTARPGIDLYGDYTIDIVVEIQNDVAAVYVGSLDQNPPINLSRLKVFTFKGYSPFEGLIGVTASTGGANAEQSIYSLKLTTLPPGTCLAPPATITRAIVPTASRPLEWGTVEAWEQGVATNVSLSIDEVRQQATGACEVPTQIRIEEVLPASWTANTISDGGTFSAGKVTWNLSGASIAVGKVLTYKAVPAGQNKVVQFIGTFWEPQLADPPLSGVEGEATVYPKVDPGIDDLGFVTTWLLLGPFVQQDGDNPGAALMMLDHLSDGIKSELTILPKAGDAIESDYGGASAALSLQATPTRTSLNPGGVPAWLAWYDGDDTIIFDDDNATTLNDVYDTVNNVMAYAMVYVTNETGSLILSNIGVGSDDSIQVILNGSSIWVHSIPRGGGAAHQAQDSFPGILNPGVNRVMVKVYEGGGGFNFRLGFRTEDLQPITSGLSVSLTPPTGGCPVPPVEIARSFTLAGSVTIEGIPTPAYTDGSEVSVRLGLSNVRAAGGGCPAAGAVTIVEFLPSGWTASGITGGGTFSAGKITWNLTAVQLGTTSQLTYKMSGPITSGTMGVGGSLRETGNSLSFGVGGQSTFPCDWGLSPDGFILTWLTLGPFRQPVPGAGFAYDNPGDAAMRLDYLTDGAGITEAEIADGSINPRGGDEVETDYAPGAAASIGIGATPFGINPSGIPMWVDWRDADGNVNFQHGSLYGAQDQVMAYALVYFTVDAAMDVTLACGSDDSIQILLDANEAWIHSIPRGWGGGTPQDVTAPFTLTAGPHRLIVKVYEGGGDWNFGVRFQDPTSAAPITKGLTFTTTPPDVCVPCKIARMLSVTTTAIVEGVEQPAYVAGGTVNGSLVISAVRKPGGVCPALGTVTLIENLAAGWSATNISNGGSFSAGKITWTIPGAQLGSIAQLTYQASGPATYSRVNFFGTIAEAGNPDIFPIEGMSGVPTGNGLREDGAIMSWLILGPYTQDVFGDPAAYTAPDPSVLQQDFLTDGVGVTEKTVNPRPAAEVNTDYTVAASTGLAPTLDPDINPNDKPQWYPWLSTTEMINFQNVQLYDLQDQVMAYSACYIHVTTPLRVTLAVGSDDSVQVLLDGNEVWINSVLRSPLARQDRTPAIDLSVGVHLLVVKTFEAGGDWQFGVAIMDETGTEPLVEGYCVCLNPSPTEGCGCGGVTPPERFKRGDSNRDGGVNIADAVYILQNLFAQGPPILCKDAADSNDDEGVNIADAVYILQNLFAQGPAIPPPGSKACGPDTTGKPGGGADLPACVYPADKC